MGHTAPWGAGRVPATEATSCPGCRGEAYQLSGGGGAPEMPARTPTSHAAPLPCAVPGKDTRRGHSFWKHVTLQPPRPLTPVSDATGIAQLEKATVKARE